MGATAYMFAQMRHLTHQFALETASRRRHQCSAMHSDQTTSQLMNTGI